MKKKRIFLILTIVFMAVIFSFSARDGDTSAADSCRVGKAVCSIIVPGYKNMPEEKQLQYAQAIDHPVRKTAHATEYAVLGILIYCAGGRILCSILISISYACTDEIHQYFVPGRACMFTDVCIDTAGALVGILIVAILTYLRRKQS